mmetsp:Transcript_14006/g.34653  ORF Transcript_14006/g.34653 Transcript_14006/m.34653 type:complete len:276 (-) Transcript_14006:1913-2740(-)
MSGIIIGVPSAWLPRSDGPCLMDFSFISMNFCERLFLLMYLVRICLSTSPRVGSRGSLAIDLTAASPEPWLFVGDFGNSNTGSSSPRAPGLPGGIATVLLSSSPEEFSSCSEFEAPAPAVTRPWLFDAPAAVVPPTPLISTARLPTARAKSDSFIFALRSTATWNISIRRQTCPDDIRTSVRSQMPPPSRGIEKNLSSTTLRSTLFENSACRSGNEIFSDFFCSSSGTTASRTPKSLSAANADLVTRAPLNANRKPFMVTPSSGRPKLTHFSHHL